jgi:hypothetical protein
MVKKIKKVVGFKPLPKDKKKSVRVLTFLSEPEHKKLLIHCERLNTKPSIFIRERLKDILDNA